jgi:hypothetical protein
MYFQHFLDDRNGCASYLGEELPLGPFRLRVVHTPGHRPAAPAPPSASSGAAILSPASTGRHSSPACCATFRPAR